MKTQNINKNVKDKKIIIVLIIIILLCVLASVGAYFYIIKKQSLDNNKVNKFEVSSTNKEKIDAIKEQNNSAYKEFNNNIEYLTNWTYSELVNNFVDSELLVPETEIKILINDVEIIKDSEIKFDEVKALTMEIILTKNYKYQVSNSQKEEIVTIDKEYNLEVKDTIFPVINGVKNITINVGDKLDLLKGITATDEKEGSLEVLSEGTVDNQKAGTYDVVIYAVDHNGNRTDAKMQVTVKKKSTTTTPKPSTGSSNNSSSSSSNSSSSANSSASNCSSSSILKKRGYRTTDKNACEKDKQSSEIAKQIANEILAKGYSTDLEKVSVAAEKVSSYYFNGTHVEEGDDYRTPYGVFIKGEASCAGCTRALILVLEYMGYTNLVHANENGWTHQWVILTMDGQKGFADGQVGMVGYGCHMVDEECLSQESN